MEMFSIRDWLFYQRMKGTADNVFLYENEDLQRKARSLVPVSELQERAKVASDKSKENGNEGFDEQDFFIIELYAWFKEFFSWMDKPKCSDCGVQGEGGVSIPPTPDEKQWGPSTVEGYSCPNCGSSIRFPRYNHPEKLLETRTGRCGEWANAFTLFCRALGYEARYVVDWTDHVWTEVFSEAQQRWKHSDGICSKELFYDCYEKWWKKKLTYIVAYSKDEVVDVTWRYTDHPEDVLKRRTECSENWLSTTISSMTQQRQKNLPLERKQELQMRHVRELAEFMRTYKHSEESEDP